MKICNNCKRVQSDSTKTCSNCSSSSFRQVLIDIDELAEEVLAEKNHKRKKKMMLALLLLFVIFLIIILITIVKLKQDADNNINSYSNIKHFLDRLVYTKEGN